MPNIRHRLSAPLLEVDGVRISDLIARVVALEARVAELLARVQRLEGAA